jgi:integrase
MKKTTIPPPYPSMTTNDISSNDSNSTSSTTINGKAYFNFVNSIKSPASRKTYEFSLRKYMQYHNLQVIDDLLADKNTPSVIEDQIIAWLVSLRETITYSTRHTYMAAILNFYEINDVTLRTKRIARFLGQESTRKNKDRAYTTEEIKKMLEHANIRSKVLVLLLASSGMRIGAVPDLKLKHFTKVQEPYNLYKIAVYENTREEYNAYCTPECAAAIDAYITYRQEKGEKITPEAPLIRESFDKLLLSIKDKDNNNENESNFFFSTTKKAPETLAIRGIGAIISNLLVSAGIVKVRSCSAAELQNLGGNKYNSGGGSVRKSVRRAHGFRKYLLTALTEVGIDPQYRKILLGQNLGLDESYLKPTEQQVLQQYVKAIDTLTFNDEYRLQRKVVVLEKKQDDIDLMKLEQKKKDKRLEDLEKSLQAQLETQRRQQELLESLWLHQQRRQQQGKNQLSQKKDFTSDPHSPSPVRVEKVTVSRRNEPSVPPTPVAETFLLVDNNKSNNGNNSYDWFNNWSMDESPRGSWRHLPTTKEQEEKWHHAMIEGLKREQNNKNNNNDNLK